MVKFQDGWRGIHFFLLIFVTTCFKDYFLLLSFLWLQYIYVSNNKLTGEIPSLICNASSVAVLDLSHKHLSGMIPKFLVHSNVLKMLDL